MRISDLLRSLDVGGIQADLRKLFTRIDDNFQVLKRALNNEITFSDNIKCDIITARFDSGVPRGVPLRNLKTARSGILLGSSVPAFGGPSVIPGSDGASVILRFAQNAKSVLATVVLFEEGTSSGTGSLIATANAAGLVKPDGTSTTVATDGTLSANGLGNITLAAGADGTVLTARSTAPTGFAWESGGAWSLASKPSPADSRDEEFEGAEFARWTKVGATVATAIDPDANFVTANTYRYAWNTTRPSWFMIQPSRDGATGTNQGIRLASLTFGTNDLFWWRFSSTGGGANADGEASVFLGDAAFANYCIFRYNFHSGVMSYLSNLAGETFVAVTDYKGVFGPTYCYMAMRKVGTTYQFWAANESGSWVQIGALVNAGLVPTDILAIARSANTVATCAIVGYDFFRFRADASLP